MGDFKDLGNRIKFAVLLAVIALVCLAFESTTHLLAGALGLAVAYEVGVALWSCRSEVRSQGLIVVILFTYVVLGGLAVAADLRAQENGVIILLLLALTAIVTDTVAYAWGRKHGHTPFFPSISPNKTMEGVVAGLLAGLVVIASGWGAMIATDRSPLGPLVSCALMVLPFAAVAGDLLESKAKRLLGIKDFSNLLGSHGGVADRFDSITAVFAAYGLIYWIAT